MYITETFTISKENELQIRAMKSEMTDLGKVVFYRTYSRSKPKKRVSTPTFGLQSGNTDQEDWADVVIRVTEGIMAARKDWMIKHHLPWMSNEQQQEFALDMAKSMFNGEWLPAGRGLWACGTDFMRQRGSAAMNNCGACTTADLELAASWTMDMLMCGCGVGFDTVWRGKVYALNNNDDTFNFIVPDSREGWVESTRVLIHTYLTRGSKFPVFDYSQIRAPGTPLKTFGGTASGPDPLIKLHKRIQNYFDLFLYFNDLNLTRETLVEECDWLAEKYLSFLTEDIPQAGTSEYYTLRDKIAHLFAQGLKVYDHTRLIVDIMNAIGCCVVAGNIRRSSEIALGEVNNITFINLKNLEVNPERAAISWMSNNSIILRKTEDFEQLHTIADLIRKNGEPGVVNLINVQRYGRVGHHHEPHEQTKELRPDEAILCNPCGEIPLCSFELCNLVEIFLPRCLTNNEGIVHDDGETRFLNACKYAHFYASTVSLIPTHWEITNRIVAKNRRIGVSISGYADVYDHPDIGSPELIKLQRLGYKMIRSENVRLAAEAGVSESIRVTTVKPSGTISLLFGIAPGMHFPTFTHCIRRIRIAANSPMKTFLVMKGLTCIPDKSSDNTVVFEFPLDQSHNHTRPATKVTMWEQFSIMSRLQAEWSDNMVSATIYFKDEEEGKEISKALTHFAPLIKCVSMLPHEDKGVYELMPYEGITEQKYRDMVSNFPDINWSDYSGTDGIIPKFCDSEKCEM
jgi:ribonucleoside-triphosphate reductase